MNEITTKQYLELLSYKELSQMLGVQKSTLQVWICKRRLPSNLYVKLGSRVLFFKNRIIDWLNEGAPMQKPVKRAK